MWQAATRVRIAAKGGFEGAAMPSEPRGRRTSDGICKRMTRVWMNTTAGATTTTTMTETKLEKENTKTRSPVGCDRDQGASWLRGDGHGGRSTQDTGGQAHADGSGL